MLRISIVDSPEEQRIVLQGKLTEPWISELRTVWQATRSELGERKCVVDLNDATLIDPCGLKLLSLMHCQGVRFVAKGVLTKYFLKCLKREARPEAGSNKEDAENTKG